MKSSNRFDVIFVLPYLFSDHPSFPEGILKKVLENDGFKVGVIEQPFWQKPSSFTILGRPNYFFAVISGPVDSTVLNYTANRKRRYEDSYQLGGKSFFPGYPDSIKYKIRPDNTVIVFSNRLKESFKDIPIVIGGVESTLRRFAYYDFQKDKIRRSVLFDSRASLLVNGPGEKQIVQIARELRDGKNIEEIRTGGVTKIVKEAVNLESCLFLPSYEDILSDKKQLMKSYLTTEKGEKSGKILCQKTGDRYVMSLPGPHYTKSDIDNYYSFSYERYHPGKKRYSPALRMNLFSITSHRGCEGGCSFCSISLLEGKKIISRSPEAIAREVRRMMKHPEWRGIVSDIGGPSAEMYGDKCDVKKCMKISCIYPEKCSSLGSGVNYLQLLRSVRSLKGVRKVFVGSGVRYDKLAENKILLEELLSFHSGKFIRIAPEHTVDRVLKIMGKPDNRHLRHFLDIYREATGKTGVRLKLSPYLIVGHPGESYEDVIQMSKDLKDIGLNTKDVQIFTPTPGSCSTAMYYSETDRSGNEIEVEKNIKHLMKRKNIITGRE